MGTIDTHSFIGGLFFWRYGDGVFKLGGSGERIRSSVAGNRCVVGRCSSAEEEHREFGGRGPGVGDPLGTDACRLAALATVAKGREVKLTDDSHATRLLNWRPPEKPVLLAVGTAQLPGFLEELRNRLTRKERRNYDKFMRKSRRHIGSFCSGTASEVIVRTSIF